MRRKTDRKDLTYPFWMQISTCLFGVSLYLLSYYPAIVQDANIKIVLQQIGLGVLIFGITAFLITHRYNVIASRQIYLVSNEIKSLTIDAFDLVKNARNSGVERIYPLRTGEISKHDQKIASIEFRERIQQEFRMLQDSKEKNKIRMIGISFREFFTDQGLLSDVTEKLMKNENVKFEIFWTFWGGVLMLPPAGKNLF
jgi:hypothetical protein